MGLALALTCRVKGDGCVSLCSCAFAASTYARGSRTQLCTLRSRRLLGLLRPLSSSPPTLPLDKMLLCTQSLRVPTITIYSCLGYGMGYKHESLHGQ